MAEQVQPRESTPGGGRYDAIVVGSGHNGLIAAGYLARAGKLRIAAEAFRLRKLETSALGTGTDIDVATGELGRPKWSGQLRLNYENGPFRAFWQTRYIGKSLYDVTFTRETQDQLSVGSYYLHNLGVSFDINKRMEFRFNVNNVFNRFPERPGSGFNYYDPIGRYFIAGASVKF